MKATGIVRRMDDLGRVVIPKEIRRTQMIRVGDPLEIFVSGGGEVVFKKYSPLGELSALAAELAEVMQKTAGLACMVADRDHVMAGGGLLRTLADKPLAAAYTKLVERRRLALGKPDDSPPVCEQAPYPATAVMPILCHGDLIGSVALSTPHAPTESEAALLRLVGAFLRRRLED